MTVLSQNQQDIFCLTNIAKFKNPDHPDDVIRNWPRTRSTVEFPGVWERLNNPSFNPVEFDGIITKAQTALVYANEADLLNVALFGQTAKQWRDAHPDAEGNIRDHAPLEQLVVLTNLESLNSVLTGQGLPQPERLATLNGIAITQMRTLLSANNIKRLK